VRGSNATDMIAGFMPTRTLHSPCLPVFLLQGFFGRLGRL
jgi:hypothetical protein